MMEDLLVKYLLEEATSQEKQEVQQWLDADPENQRHFNQFKTIWEESARIFEKSKVDENTAWERFQQRVANAEQNQKGKTISLTSTGRSWMRAAALIIVLISASWFGYRQLLDPTIFEINSGNDILAVTLPDESVVTLHKNTTLSYPSRFKGNSRKVTLVGEAFFDISPDDKKPFYIHANDATIRVVGTSFNVKTTSDSTEIIVATGLVEVTKEDNGILLHPNEKAVVRKDKLAPEKLVNTDKLYNFYHTRELVCDDTPLWRVTQALEEVYGLDIIVADQLKNLPLTATFNNEPIDNILQVIGETFQVQVRRNGNEVIIR